MFRPIHLLQQFNTKDKEEYQERWNRQDGRAEAGEITNLINAGAGKHFLDGFNIPEDFLDLKGFKFWQLDIDFPDDRDHFIGINFSYSEFWHSRFNSAVFSNIDVAFAKIYNCKFENCFFSFTDWYGTRFERVKFKKSDFLEKNSFNNCEFMDCEFDEIFIQRNIFHDCFFNSSTTIPLLAQRSYVEFSNGQIILDNKELPEIYKGIKNAYLAGEVFDKYRKYFFNQKRSETRHLKSGLKKLGGYFIENLTGYGIRPTTVLSFMFLIILVFFFCFLTKYSFSESAILSAGAFATVGDIPVAHPYDYLYILESALGIGFFSLLITVLANIWFSEK